MVWRRDDHRVDVIAIQHSPEVAGAQLRFLFVVRHDVLVCLGDLGLVDIAQSDSLRLAGLEHVVQVAPAHAAATDQPEANAIIGAENAAGRGRGHGHSSASSSAGQERTARCSHWIPELLWSPSELE